MTRSAGSNGYLTRESKRMKIMLSWPSSWRLKDMRTFWLLITILILGLSIRASAQDRVVYTHCTVGVTCDIILMKSDGRFPVNLTRNTDHTFSTSPAVSPDGKSIAFSHRPDFDRQEIVVMNLVTRETRQITGTFPDFAMVPSWSPDGRKIAYSSCNVIIAPYRCDNLTINADGSGEPVSLSNSPDDDNRPRFSPDGSRVLFDSNRSGNFDIWVCNSDGSNPQRLTGNTADDQFPNWSPDGTKIIFSSYRNNMQLNLFLMDIDGANLRQLTHGNDADSEAFFSTNGQRVAWSRSLAGDPEICEASIDDMDHPSLLTTNFTFGANWQPYYGFVTRKVGRR